MALPSPYLSKPVTKVDIEQGKGAHFEFAVANCQGWRITQEDAHMAVVNFDPNTALFGIFDGHNGPEVARFVSGLFPVALRRNDNYKEGNVERGIEEAFMIVDKELRKDDNNATLLKYREEAAKAFDIAGNHKWPPSSSDGPVKVALLTGSTGVVLLIKNDIYYCANVGDSRCVLARDGKALALSKDHKPDQPEEKARIEKAGGEVTNGRINGIIDVSRAFGDLHFKGNEKLDAKQQMITAWPHTKLEHVMPRNDQFVVLMCDGVWNAMANQQVVDFVAKQLEKNIPLGKICEDIVKQILPSVMPERGIVGKDNMTVMIIKPLVLAKQDAAPHSASSKSSKPKSRDMQCKSTFKKASPSMAVKAAASKTKKHTASCTKSQMREHSEGSRSKTNHK